MNPSDESQMDSTSQVELVKQELLETERNYVNDLRLIKEVCINNTTDLVVELIFLV